MISYAKMSPEDRSFLAPCIIKAPLFAALLTAVFLTLILAAGLGGCGKKEEEQKLRSQTSEIPPEKMKDQLPVAIMSFQNQTGDPALDWMSMGIAELLRTDLSQSPSLNVLTGQRLFNLLRMMGAEGSPPTDVATATQVARKAGSQAMVMGSFSMKGEALGIDLQVLDVATGNLIASESEEGRGLESIFALVDRLSRTIEDGLNVSLTGSDQDIVNLTTSSVEAYELFTRGMEKFYRFRLIEAVAFMERAVDMDLNFGLAYSVMAAYLNSIGDVRRTTAATAKAMSLLDRLPSSDKLMVMAIDAQIRGDYDQGERLYQKLMGSAAEEKDPIAQLGLGQLYFAKEQLEGSKRIYKRILQQDSNQAAGHFMLGLIQFQQGIKDSAESELREAVRLSPDIAGAHLLLAQICFLQGQMEEAESHMQSAIIADPENPSIRNFVGYQYLNQGKYDQALVQLKQYVALAPDDPNSHDSLAEGYFRQGDLGGAEKEYLQAIKLDPNFANPHYMLARIYEQNGQLQKTIRQLKEYIRLDPESTRAKSAQKRLEKLQQG